ncbi:MAG: L-lactate permease [Bacillota bacterium]
MVRWLLASSPLFVLLFTLLKLKWKAKDAGATALAVALLVGGFAFGGHMPLLAVACAKGVSLTLFVVLIIWTSGFMYQMVNQTGSVPVISKWMATLSKDRLMLGLLVGWCLSGVIQAVAGYGVPVAVCAPLMIAAGFVALDCRRGHLLWDMLGRLPSGQWVRPSIR